MTRNDSSSASSDLTAKTLNVVITVGLVLGLLIWCFFIIRPFVMVLLWGVIIAVTIFPFYAWLKGRLGNRRSFASILVTMILLLAITIPFVPLAESLHSEAVSLNALIDAGKLSVPPPSASVKSWPLIGKRTFQLWHSAANDPESLVMQFKPQAKALLVSVLGFARDAGIAFILFVVSIIVSGILLYYSDSGGKFVRKFSNRLMGSKGQRFVGAAETTIRNVSTGILGVAFIQAVLAGIGFLVAGVPGAGLWALIALFLAIIQVSILPVCLVVVIYTFLHATTFVAVALLIWCVLVGLMDNVLKPLLIGRGSAAPMLVIFLGAIGGLLLSGFIGLFVGAVVLSLGYALFKEWLKEAEA